MKSEVKSHKLDATRSYIVVREEQHIQLWAPLQREKHHKLQESRWLCNTNEPAGQRKHSFSWYRDLEKKNYYMDLIMMMIQTKVAWTVHLKMVKMVNFMCILYNF